MKTFRRLMIVVFALCAGLTLAAQSATTEMATPAPGSIKVTFWYGLTGFNGEVVKSLVNRYNTSQTKYFVEAISQPDYDATINKLNTSLAGGELPNLVQVYDIGTQRMVDTKKIVPVQQLAAKDNQLAMINDLEPALASYYTIGGTLYSMPFNSSAPVMYFDKTAFKAAGLDVNKRVWTYDELLAATKKLTVKAADGTVSRYGIGFTLYSWILEEEIATQGALFTDPANGRETRARSFQFNGMAGQNWLNFLKSSMDSGVAECYGVDGGANSTARDSAFVSGKAAITFNSIAALRGYAANAEKAGKGVDVGVAYIPRPAGAKGGVIIGGASLWITSTGSAEQQAGSWDFVKFASSPASQAYFAGNTGYYPVRKAAYNVPDMKATLTKFPQFQVAIDQLHESPKAVATAGAVFGTFVKARSNIQSAMEQFITGKTATAKQALDDAAKKSATELEEYNLTVQ